MTMDDKVETIQFELQQVREENNTLKLMLEVMSIKCTKLESQLQEIKEKTISSNQIDVFAKTSICATLNPPQIGLEDNLNETSKRTRLEFPTAKKPIQVFVRTHSNDDCLKIEDGYQWRKYGQKVTKDNDSPRAYFRCSMAPSCPAKKKVQKCIHDRSILVATYDGEHNHSVPHESLRPSSSTPKGSSIAIKLPSTLNDKEARNIDFAISDNCTGLYEDVMQKCGYGSNIKIEEYASSLIKDPNFTSALAEAVAHTITGHHKRQGLNPNLDLSKE